MTLETTALPSPNTSCSLSLCYFSLEDFLTFSLLYILLVHFVIVCLFPLKFEVLENRDIFPHFAAAETTYLGMVLGA